MQPEWTEVIRDHCGNYDVAFYNQAIGQAHQEGGWQGTGGSPSRYFSKAKEAAGDR